MKKVTIFVKFVIIKEHATLEDVLNRIRICAYGQLIREIRRKIRNGDIKGADNIKRTLLAFTPSGRFEKGRRLENLVEYTNILVLDIDKLSEDELIALKKKIAACIYTLACFVSPSGHGLKVLVCVSTGQHEHLQTFITLQKYYENLTGAVIDASGKDITRLCYLSMDSELYYNPGATIFDPHDPAITLVIDPRPDPPAFRGYMTYDTATGEAKADPAPKKPVEPDKKRISDIYANSIAHVERSLNFVEGSRNNFVFNLALQLRRGGLAEGAALFLLLQDYNFDEREVRNCVKSAYRYVWTGRNPVKDNMVEYRESSAAGTGEETAPPAGDAVEEDPPETNREEAAKMAFIEAASKAVMKTRGRGQAAYDLETVEASIKAWCETRYNEVLGVVEWREKNSRKKFYRMNDYGENTLFRKLHLEGQEIPLSNLHALLLSNFSPSYHPFRSYLRKLKKWDGQTDYIAQLTDTVKTEDDAYWSFCFKKWFVAFIASWMIPEVINHTVIVFIGAQGIGKTSWIKLLVSKELQDYIGTSSFHTDSKDTQLQLAECIIVVLDEMESLNRKDLASFKELITRNDIRIRRPYGRNADNLERVASFIASVNHEQILTDTSGSRRYLCFKVTEIDYQHKVAVDKAIAQAVELYKSGFKFWFDQDEIRELIHKNEDFSSKSVEEELIETWVKPATRKEWAERKRYVNEDNIQLLTATEIAGKLMEKVRFNLLDSTIIKIGRILKKQGFERVRKGNNYLYLLRMVDPSVVEKGYHTLENLETEKEQIDANEQVIRFEEDLVNSTEHADLPF
jgi:hypothetical protein